MALIRFSTDDQASRPGAGGWKILVWLLAAGVAIAGSSATAQDVADSLYLPAMGARALGMGGASVASSSDLSCAAGNPALLAFMIPWGVAVDYRHLSARVQGLSIYAVNDLARPKLTYGLGIDAVRADRRVWPRTPSVMRNWTAQVTLGVAHLVSDRVAVGAALKPARWQLYGENDNTIEMDMGVAYPTHWRDIEIVAGAVARDFLGSEVTRRGSDTALDVSVLLGLTGRYFFGDSLWEATLAADLEAVERDYINDPQDRFRFGGELTCYKWDDIRPAVRLGHDGERVSFGLGIDYRFVSIDWAKTVWTKWGHGQAVSVSIDPRGFWDWFEETIGAFNPLVSWRDSLPIYRSEQYHRYERAAREQLEAQRYDSAAVLYQSARVFADSSQQLASADSALAVLRAALDRLSTEAEAMMLAALQDSLLQREREFTDTKHRQLLVQADSCLMRRDYESSLDLLVLVLAEDTANAEALDLKSKVERARELEVVFSLVLADGAEKDEQLGKALEAYSRILELDSTHAEGDRGRRRIESKLDARRLVGRALRRYEQSDLAGAMVAIDSAVGRDPSLQRVRDFLEITYHTQSDTISLDEIAQDTTIYVYYIQGLQHRSNHAYQQAMEAFSKVLRVYPNCAEVKKVYDEARELYNKLVQDSTTP